MTSFKKSFYFDFKHYDFYTGVNSSLFLTISTVFNYTDKTALSSATVHHLKYSYIEFTYYKIL